jgi:hypothetical protein
MASNPRIAIDEEFAREAKAIVALAFRNGPIENLHAGKRCPACAAKEGFSRITDEEVKRIMKNAVNQMAELLWLRDNDPVRFLQYVEFGNRYTRQWDDPEFRPARCITPLFSI